MYKYKHLVLMNSSNAFPRAIGNMKYQVIHVTKGEKVMHRTIYDTTTGEILSCRRIPDHMLDNNINRRPNTAYLNTYVQDISVKKVDLSNLSYS